VVHGCLDECPRIVCIDKCRAGLEDCRKLGKGICELSFNECEAICEETYSNNEELWSDFSIYVKIKFKIKRYTASSSRGTEEILNSIKKHSIQENNNYISFY
jgi:hypothetical protein